MAENGVNFEKIFSIAVKNKCRVIYIVTNRDGWKTSGTLGYLAKIATPTEKICILKRTQKLIDEVVRQKEFFDAANKWYNAGLSFSGREIIRESDGEAVGIFEAISDRAKIKEKGYSGYKYFLLDEAQPDDLRYFPGETEAVPSIMESMGRELYLSGECFLILLSNNITNFDKWTDFLGLEAMQLHRYQCRHGVLKVVQTFKRKENVFSAIFENYTKNAAKNKVALPSNISIFPRPQKLNYFCDIKINNLFLYVDYDEDGNYHILVKNKPRYSKWFDYSSDENGGGFIVLQWEPFQKLANAYYTGRVFVRDEKQRERCAGLFYDLGFF